MKECYKLTIESNALMQSSKVAESVIRWHKLVQVYSLCYITFPTKCGLSSAIQPRQAYLPQ